MSAVDSADSGPLGEVGDKVRWYQQPEEEQGDQAAGTRP